MDLIINDRGKRPETWPNPGKGMGYHHVIPVDLLKSTWNRLVVLYVDTDLSDARVAMRQFLYLSTKGKDEIDALMDRMRVHNNAGSNGTARIASQYRPAPLETPDFDVLRTRVIWPPWNVVEGPEPESRSDNPGKGEFDRFTVGLTEQERDRMKALDHLFTEFELFINAGKTPRAVSLILLATAASAVRELLNSDQPILFRPGMWFDEGGGKWRKRRYADLI